MINVGKLRHRLEAQQAVETQASDGDPVVSWSTLGTVWGRIEPLRGRESTYAGEQTLAETDTRITLRYGPLTSTLTAKHRLVHQGTAFNVVQIAHLDLAKQEVVVMAKSGINDG